jgi:trk system potassium uptake protein TrkA
MRFCIIGLGAFGTHLARELSREGHEIVAVDNDPACVAVLKDEIEYIVQADCSDLNAFHEIPIDSCDALILTIGENFESSLNIASNVQQLGAKRIINPRHGRLLKLLKIDELMIPEAMAAAWLARSLKTPDVINSLALGSGYEIAQIAVPSSFVGQTLLESDLRSRSDLNLVTVAKARGMTERRSTHHAINKVLGIPAPDRKFEADDVLVLFGQEKSVRRLMRDQ